MSVFMLPNGYFLSQAVIIALFLWSLIDKERSEPNFLVDKSSTRQIDDFNE